jgi:hypothetical protein
LEFVTPTSNEYTPVEIVLPALPYTIAPVSTLIAKTALLKLLPVVDVAFNKR